MECCICLQPFETTTRGGRFRCRRIFLCHGRDGAAGLLGIGLGLLSLGGHCVAADGSDDQPIVLPPVVGASGPVKMVVFIPGGNVPNERYTATAQAIQSSVVGVRLWAAIAAVPKRLCILSCATASLCRLRNDVDAALTMAVKAGWKRGDDASDVWLAGHSLGGTCANRLFQASSTNGSAPFAGLLVMGSYVDESGNFDLTSYKRPVLTLNAELDGGLARPGKTSTWFRQYLDIASARGDAYAIANKPVIVLPKLNHSDFCPGFDVPKDLMAEVSQAEATATIGNYAGAFFQVHSSGNATARVAALRTLEYGVAWTRGLLSPYLVAQDMERNASDASSSTEGASKVCAEAQRKIAGLSVEASKRLVVSDGFHASTSGLVHCHPSSSVDKGSSLVVGTCSHADYYTDIANTGSITAASQVACKMFSREWIAMHLNATPAAPSDVSCSEVNQLSVQAAMQLAAPSTFQRYKKRGRGWCFLEDQPVPGNVGPLWVYSYSLKLVESAECMSVSSPILKTSLDSKIYPGSHYCKVLSPARVLDWMMTDSLKRPSVARTRDGTERAQAPLIVV